MTWLARLLRRKRLEVQLDAELRDHVERLVADGVAAGLDPIEARRQAMLSFGALDSVKDACRDARGTQWIETLGQDVRYGIRMLRRSPAFTVVAVLSLALGIGANTAIFSLVNSLLLRSLPVKDPQQLVLLEGGSWTNPIWEQIRERQHELFASAAAFSSFERFDLSAGGQAELVGGLWASGNFFDVLGVPAVLGRTFTAQDDRRGGGPDGPVAVISHSFWLRRYGGAGDIVGRAITLNRVAFTIVGVTPASFRGPTVGQAFDVAIPIGCATLLPQGPVNRLDARSWWWLDIVARLRPGQTIDQANAGLRGVQPQIQAATMPQDWRPQDKATYLRDALTLVPSPGGPSELRNQYKRPLLTIMAVVGIVLLVACANIANLLLARARERQHELAMRRALGASGFRVGRQLLTESVLLSLAGAALGLFFAQWFSRLLVGQISTSRDQVMLDLPLDWRVLAFTTAVAIGTALLFGLAPAWRGGRADPIDALKQQGRNVVGARRRGAVRPLVVVQVALSLVLVFAAGLFVRTFAALATLDLGFEQESVLVVSINAERTGLAPADLPALYLRIADAAAAVPGVRRAAISDITPVSGMQWNNILEFPGKPDLPEKQRVVNFNRVSPGWFATYGTPLRAGRDFTPQDRSGSPRVAIVNEAFVRRYTAGGRAIGVTFRELPRPGSTRQPIEIVGVVKDAVYRSVREPHEPIVYLPTAQSDPDEMWPVTNVSVLAAGGDPSLLVRSVSAAITAVDGNLSLTFRPLADQVSASIVRERILALLSGFFGGLALLLAGLGLYGVTSYAVAQRRPEIGVRMALGASAGKVVRLVVRNVAAMVGAGILIGTLLSLWAARFVDSLLFAVSARDAATLAGAALTLLLIAALAAWLPARRAVRIDPAEVLREA